MPKTKLKYICKSFNSTIKASETLDFGKYEVFGASGLSGYLNNYEMDTEYLGIVKDGAGVGRINIYPPKTSLVGTMAYIIPNERVHINWLKYYMQGLNLGVGIDKSTIDHIYFSDYGNTSILDYPTFSKQQAIANFLDDKCSKIDSLTKDIEKEIEILKEYKKSVITESVTKGLNLDAEMKESGIDWIGQIPSKWSIQRLKFCLKKPLLYGANESGIEYDSNLPRYIRITDINDDGSLKEDGKQSLTNAQAMGYILENNDLLFARSGATVGKTFLYKNKYGKAAFAGYLIKASLDNKKVLPEFVTYITNSSYYTNWKDYIFSQATIQNIGADKYNQLPIIIAPLEEQQQIVIYLDDKCSKIDSLIKNKEKQLEKLQDYKKSLIYEYVTGKKRI